MKYDLMILVDDDDTAIFCNKTFANNFSPHSKIISFQNPLDFVKEYNTNLKKDSQKMLLILDINMPQMHGFELMELLEEDDDDDFLNVDVIILTTSNLKSDSEKATHFKNIIGYIEKPLSVEKLNSIMNKRIGV